MLRKRSGISVTVSNPVRPPPATTTVLRAAFAGLWAKFLRCWSSFSASSNVFTLNPYSLDLV